MITVTVLQDGSFHYECDGENRLKALTTRGDIADFTKLFRLEFAYDYMGRRIAKKYRVFDGDPGELLTTPADKLKSWTNPWEQRFIWDSGPRGGYGNLSASYLVDPNDGTYLGADQSYAWGPDMSGTEIGAGGIGGLAIASLSANVLNTSATSYVPLYDGHGNVISLRNNSAQELAAYTYGPYGETTAATGSRWAEFEVLVWLERFGRVRSTAALAAVRKSSGDMWGTAGCAGGMSGG